MVHIINGNRYKLPISIVFSFCHTLVNSIDEIIRQRQMKTGLLRKYPDEGQIARADPELFNVCLKKVLGELRKGVGWGGG